MAQRLLDPFAPVSLVIEYVDSAAGSRKTRTAVANALLSARRRGTRTIFAMPTLELIAEMKDVASQDGKVPVYAITSRDRPKAGASVEKLICQHISSAKAQVGHLLFITHEGFHRVVHWPPETMGFEIIIDETPDVILSRSPFVLRHWHVVLRSFITVRVLNPTAAESASRANAKAPPGLTDREKKILETSRAILRPTSNASEGEKREAQKQIERLEAKQDAADQFFQDIDADWSEYYQVLATPEDDPAKSRKQLEHMVQAQPNDDILRYLEPVPRWLLQNSYLFTNKLAWDRMISWRRDDPDPYRRGTITITGFRRPDALQAFGRVTIMSALFKHTMLYAVWTTLGVRFVPSQAIPLAKTTTDLGARRLRIYWLVDQGWSKTQRDRSGGIYKILELIRDANVINLDEPVCVVVNKDDGSERNPEVVRKIFPTGIVMPHNVRGQSKWQEHHQLIHCAALNSYTPDIRWLESALGIDALTQRLGRTGQEVYQSLMRLSLREPSETHDITLVVMDKDVAEWLPQWFSPIDQVEVSEITSAGVIVRRLKPGRPKSPTALSSAERMRRMRRRKRGLPEVDDPEQDEAAEADSAE